MMASRDAATQAGRRRIRLGMVGGGQGAFIGAVHRIAARMDDQYELVAGALVVGRRKRAMASAAELGLAPDRAYGAYEEMAKAEARAAGRHRGGRRSSRRTTCTRRSPRPSSKPASTSSATSR